MNKILLLPFMVLGVFACSDNDEIDTTKPTIELITPGEGTIFHPGDVIDFSCIFSDNHALHSYKVNIHNNFDGHEHTALLLKSATDDDHGEAWTYENTWFFEDGLSTAQVNHQDIIIPETITHDSEQEEIAEGHYHLGIYCIDEARNENQYFIEIEIEHEDE